ncbi:hypothetical protein GCM10009129_03650 [Psychrobacter aestuarii]|uniref:Uncharacterized protein n=1 Tax=Psychrobacter aestuarii TaxID=556327 RepID=A0ABN0VL72_9GAMM
MSATCCFYHKTSRAFKLTKTINKTWQIDEIYELLTALKGNTLVLPYDDDLSRQCYLFQYVDILYQVIE